VAVSWSRAGKTGVPNLDAMDADELMDFWAEHQHGHRYLDLFPRGGPGTRSATSGLAHYAANKAAAIGCRTRGEIETALMYEGIADRIYAKLPAFARW
jgi:hypothetical protein